MSEAVPVSLFITRRALCPGCGAALQLELGQSEIACRYCGSVSYVERRLRTVEAELREGLEPSQIERKTRFIPAHSIGAGGKAETACPGCGGTVEITGSQDTATCPHCGSRAKVEQRLIAGPEKDWSGYADDADLEAFAARDPMQLSPSYPDGYGRWEEEAKTRWCDELNDDRIHTLLTSPDLDRQFRAASSFQGWREMSPRRERMLARVMTLCCTVPPELQICISSEIINNLLFGNAASDANKRAVFRAAGRSLFRPGLSRALMRELGLAWDGAMLKLMLELAEYQLTHDRIPDTMHALHGAHMAMRDYGMRYEIGEVMLYRLLYLTPPILAWVVKGSIHNWQIDDYWRVVLLVDDCAFERPELAPVIREELGAPMPPTDFAEYRVLLDRVDTLLSPLAQEFALDKYRYHPDSSTIDTGMDDLEFILNWFAPRLADPLFHKIIRTQIVAFIGQLARQDLPPIDAFIKQHNEALSPHIRYRYLQQRPDTKLIEKFHPGNLYESDRREPTPLQLELDQWQDKFSEHYDELDKQHKEHFRRFDDLRIRIKSEDDAAYEQQRHANEKQREAKYARDAAEAKNHEAKQKQRQQKGAENRKEWQNSGQENIKRRIAECRRQYKDTGDPQFKAMIESLKQAKKLYNTPATYAESRWYRRLLRRLTFWR